MTFTKSESQYSSAWRQLSKVTDADAAYPIGVDFRLAVSEQFPWRVFEDDHRKVPVYTSAFSEAP